MAGDREPQLCKNLPDLFSSFVDTFVDFSVSGLFLPPPPSTPNSDTPSDTFYPSPDRLIAVGDIHGDLEKCKQSLLLAGIIDDADNWCGGLLASHVNYGLERINKEVRDWINGVRKDLWRDISRGRDSVVWVRRLSHELAESCDCEALEHVLATIPGVKRMIMGHTIQMKGINGACEGKAIRIDVGMSRGCGNGLPEVLEIKNSEVWILTANPAYRDSYGARELRGGRRDGLGVLLEDRPKQIQVRA